MKKTYLKPSMQVVKLQQRHILCGSGSDGYNSFRGDGNQLSRGGNSDDDWD